MYYTCNWCGCNLDPGEKCDCENSKAIGSSKRYERREEKLRRQEPKKLRINSVKKEVVL